MITELWLRNFKAWSDTGRVTLAPISCFFGSNSSGKTSFLQSLLLLKQTAQSADRRQVFDFGGRDASIVSLGNFRDIIYDHDLSNTLDISLMWSTPSPFKITDTEAGDSATIAESRTLGIEVEVDYDADHESPDVEKVSYTLGEYKFDLERKSEGKYDIDSKEYRFKRVLGRPWHIPSPGKFYSFPDQVRAYYQNAAFLSDLELNFEQFCGQIYYLGPLRQDPQRLYIRSGGRPTDVGRRGELAIEALIASGTNKQNSRGFYRRRDGLRSLPRITVQEHVASWLKELNLIDSFSLEALDGERKSVYQVLVKRTRSAPPVLLTDVGFGVSQVLPVLVLLAYVPEGSTILLEQPEIHLHPAVQGKLADILIEVAKARKVQIIVESHSEHLLMRLQRRLAERELERGIELTPDDCRLYFCNNEQGKSKIEQLKLDNFGNIENWPKDFFGDAFGEAAAQTRAARNRRKRSEQQ